MDRGGVEPLETRYLQGTSVTRHPAQYLVVGMGNDPISKPYQDFANPSQLPDHLLVLRMGHDPIPTA